MEQRTKTTMNVTAGRPEPARDSQHSIADQWSSITANIAKAVTGFGSFVSHLYNLEEQQYLFACFALGNAGALDEYGLRALATEIMEQKRHVLLSNLLGQHVRETGCRVLYKLGPSPRETIIYRTILRAASIKLINKALGHAQSLTDTVLSALPDFIEEKLPIRLLHLLASHHHAALVDACISLIRALTEEHRVGAVQELATVKTPNAIGGWFDRWMLHLDFPAPPFAGDRKSVV
jgi:hypothetical protein